MNNTNNLLTQLEYIGNVLVSGNYDFSKKGSTFTFIDNDGVECTIDSFYDGTKYNAIIKGATKTAKYRHHKVIDAAYISYMMRKVPGTNNFTR